jgi:hypothetical protein
VLTNVGVEGHHWASSPTDATSYYLSVYSGVAGLVNNASRAFGLSVRCVKEFIPFFYNQTDVQNMYRQ